MDIEAAVEATKKWLEEMSDGDEFDVDSSHWAVF